MSKKKKKEVVRFGPFARALANGVRKGKTIYLSGQVSVDAEGQLVGAGNFPAQVKQAYDNVAEVLDEFGADMDDIVDETWFVTDVGNVMGDIETVFGIRSDAYGGEPQVSQTVVQISALVMPELMIEIKCIARL